MAVDSEKLILSISADVTSVKRALAKLTGDTKNETDKIKKSFDGVDKSVKYTADNMNQQGDRMTASARQVRAATVNMTAQFNDIAQQLAAGTSPFTIMAQQSSQVAQAMQAAGGGIKGFAKTIGGAFLGMLSWQSLFAAGSILALGALTKYFTGANNEAELTAKKLEDHKSFIDEITKAWGLAEGSAKGYFEKTKNALAAELAKRLEEAEATLKKAQRTALTDTGGLGAMIGGSEKGSALHTAGITGEYGISNWIGMGPMEDIGKSLFKLDEELLKSTPGFDKVTANIQRIKTEIAELAHTPFPAPDSETRMTSLNLELAASVGQLAAMAKTAIVADDSFGPLQDRITQLRKEMLALKPGAAIQFVEEMNRLRGTSLWDDMTADMKKAVDTATQLAQPIADAEKAVLAYKEQQAAAAKETEHVEEAVQKIWNTTQAAFERVQANLAIIPADLMTISHEMQAVIDKINNGMNPAFGETLEILKSLPAELRKMADELGYIPGLVGQLATVPPGLTQEGQYSQGRANIAGSEAAINAFVERIVGAEAPQGGPNLAGASSAYGVGQFIESTWLDLMKRYFPERSANKTREEILALRSDSELSRQAIRRYAEDNAVALDEAGQEISEASLHLAHFLGPAGAAGVLKAAPGTLIKDIAAITQQAINANPTILGAGSTRESVLAYAERRAGAQPTAKKEEKTPEMKFAEDLEQSAAATKVLNAELQVLAANNGIVQDFGYAVEYAKKQTELMNKANAEGVEITPKLTAQINEAADSYARATAAIKFREEAAKAAEDRQKTQIKMWDDLAGQIGNVAQSAISGFVSDLKEGISTGEAFTNMLENIVDALLNMALQTLFSKEIMGTLISGLTAGLGGGIPAIGHAAGGTVGMASHGDGRSLSPAVWSGAPRFAKGGMAGLRPGEVPIIAHEGEVIIPRQIVQRNRGRMSDMLAELYAQKGWTDLPKFATGGVVMPTAAAGLSMPTPATGGAVVGSTVDNSIHQQNSMTIDMSQSGAVTANTEDAKVFGIKIQKMIQLEMVKESRPGGLLRQGRSN